MFSRSAQQDNFLFSPVDVTRRDSLEAGLEDVKSRWGVPHGLINNAALDSPPNAPATENGPFETYPESSWDDIMAVNVKGVFLCCQVIGGAMAAAGRGAVINIGSIYGLVSPDQRIYDYRRREGQTFFKPAAYAVSKSALLNLTRSWQPIGVARVSGLIPLPWQEYSITRILPFSKPTVPKFHWAAWPMKMSITAPLSSYSPKPQST